MPSNPPNSVWGLFRRAAEEALAAVPAPSDTESRPTLNDLAAAFARIGGVEPESDAPQQGTGGDDLDSLALDYVDSIPVEPTTTFDRYDIARAFKAGFSRRSQDTGTEQDTEWEYEVIMTLRSGPMAGRVIETEPMDEATARVIARAEDADPWGRELVRRRKPGEWLPVEQAATSTESAS